VPFGGVFTITGNKIARWCDYFDDATLVPLMAALR
jgi:limonene-1,2-epoxide hydrolase